MTFAIEFSGGKNKYNSYYYQIQWKVYRKSNNNILGFYIFNSKALSSSQRSFYNCPRGISLSIASKIRPRVGPAGGRMTT